MDNGQLIIDNYPAMKDSGVDWLGKIPAHWEVKRAKFVFRLINSRSETGEELLLSVSEHYGVIPRSKVNVTMFMAESYEGYKLCKKGDLVINSLWAWSKGLGFSGYDGLVSTAYSVFRPRSKSTNYHYLNYLLRTKRYAGQYLINSKGVWTSRLLLSDSGFLTIPILLPPLAEQTAIADFLDCKTAQIDQFVALKEQTIALLQEQKTAIINRAVTQGLNPAAPMKDSGIAWLGEIPAHWEVKKLKHIGRVRTGITKNSSGTTNSQSLVPYLRVANVQNGYLDLSDVAKIPASSADLEKYQLQKGDLLMNEGGDYDKLGRGCVWNAEISPCLHQNHVFAVRIKEGVDPYWINFLTLTHYGKCYFISRSKQTTNLASISSRNLTEFPVLIPPSDEANEIMEAIKAATAKIDQAIAQAQQQIDLSKEYRESLISQAVTGKIKVIDNGQTIDNG